MRAPSFLDSARGLVLRAVLAFAFVAAFVRGRPPRPEAPPEGPAEGSDLAALAALRPWIVQHARARCGAGLSAEDIAQEALLRALASWPAFALSRGSLRRWTWGIARNVILERRRDLRFQRRFERAFALAVGSTAADASGPLEARELLRAMRDATTAERWGKPGTRTRRKACTAAEIAARDRMTGNEGCDCLSTRPGKTSRASSPAWCKGVPRDGAAHQLGRDPPAGSPDPPDGAAPCRRVATLRRSAAPHAAHRGPDRDQRRGRSAVLAGPFRPRRVRLAPTVGADDGAAPRGASGRGRGCDARGPPTRGARPRHLPCSAGRAARNGAPPVDRGYPGARAVRARDKAKRLRRADVAASTRAALCVPRRTRSRADSKHARSFGTSCAPSPARRRRSASHLASLRGGRRSRGRDRAPRGRPRGDDLQPRAARSAGPRRDARAPGCRGARDARPRSDDTKEGTAVDHGRRPHAHRPKDGVPLERDTHAPPGVRRGDWYRGRFGYRLDLARLATGRAGRRLPRDPPRSTLGTGRCVPLRVRLRSARPLAKNGARSRSDHATEHPAETRHDTNEGTEVGA
jgi:hypothetical protein